RSHAATHVQRGGDARIQHSAAHHASAGNAGSRYVTSLERESEKNTAANSTKPAANLAAREPGARHGVSSDHGSAPPTSTTGTNHHGCWRSNVGRVRRSQDSSRNA